MIELRPIADSVTEVCDESKVGALSSRGYTPVAMFEVEEVVGGRTEYNDQTQRNETTPTEKVKTVKFLMARGGLETKLAQQISSLGVESDRKSIELEDLKRRFAESEKGHKAACEQIVTLKQKLESSDFHYNDLRVLKQRLEADLGKVLQAIGEREMKKILEGV